jgi:hypothetical protein
MNEPHNRAATVENEIERTTSPSGRGFVFSERVEGGVRRWLVIASNDPQTGREYSVRVPFSALGALRRAIAHVEDAVHDDSLRAPSSPTPLPGTHGRPRGKVAP